MGRFANSDTSLNHKEVLLDRFELGVIDGKSAHFLYSRTKLSQFVKNVLLSIEGFRLLSCVL